MVVVVADGVDTGALGAVLFPDPPPELYEPEPEPEPLLFEELVELLVEVLAPVLPLPLPLVPEPEPEPLLPLPLLPDDPLEVVVLPEEVLPVAALASPPKANGGPGKV